MTTLGFIGGIFAVLGTLLFVTLVVTGWRAFKAKAATFFEGGAAFDLDDPWNWGEDIGKADDLYLSNAKVDLLGEPKWMTVQIELTAEDVSLIEACAERNEMPVQDYFLHLLRGDLAIGDLRKVVEKPE